MYFVWRGQSKTSSASVKKVIFKEHMKIQIIFEHFLLHKSESKRSVYYSTPLALASFKAQSFQHHPSTTRKAPIQRNGTLKMDFQLRACLKRIWCAQHLPHLLNYVHVLFKHAERNLPNSIKWEYKMLDASMFNPHAVSG